MATVGARKPEGPNKEPVYGDPVWISVDELDIRPAFDMRAKIDMDVVWEFAENLPHMPPILVAIDAHGRHMIIDGYYRYRAAVSENKPRVKCRVTRVRDYVEAFKLACRANAANLTVRVTNADKQHRVEVALKHEEMQLWSNRLIAEHCGVDHKMVGRIKDGLEVEHCSTSGRVVGKDGKSYPTTARYVTEQDDDEDDAKPTIYRVQDDTEEEQADDDERSVEFDQGSQDALGRAWKRLEVQIVAVFEAWPQEARGGFVGDLWKLTDHLGKLVPKGD